METINVDEFSKAFIGFGKALKDWTDSCKCAYVHELLEVVNRITELMEQYIKYLHRAESWLLFKFYWRRKASQVLCEVEYLKDYALTLRF